MNTEHRSTLPTFLTRYGTFILHVADPPVMTDCQAVVVVAQSSAMPATDWRADCVLYCAKHTHRYSFAIVGINITSVAHQLLMSGALRCHFYNAVQAVPQLKDFHCVYGISLTSTTLL